MKILYIHTYYVHRGGEDVVYENEVKLMEDAGWETKSLLFNNKKYAALKFLFFFFNPLSFIRVCRAIRQFRPDVIHIHNWFFGASPSVFIAARWMKVPVVHTIHNFRILCPSSFLFVGNELFTDCLVKLFPIEAVRRKIYRDSAFNTFWLLAGTRLHLFLRTWQRIDQLICLTGASKTVLCNSLLKIKPEKIVIKPNFFNGHTLQTAQRPMMVLVGEDGSLSTVKYPVTTLGEEEAPDSRQRSFLFIGRLSPEKGIDLLLEAFRDSPYSLRIIGDGPLRPKVEEHCTHFKNIQYLGFQGMDEIIKELSQCNALVFTTIGFEQFGNVIVEAYYCGTPVIGPDSGSPAELITSGFNGIHFKTGSATDLRSKIQSWDSLSEGDWHSYSENATDTYWKYYTPQTNYTLLSNIYKSAFHETERFHQPIKK